MNNKLLQEEETGDKASRLAMPLLQLDNGPKIAEPGQPHSYHVPLWARCATWHLKCLPRDTYWGQNWRNEIRKGSGHLQCSYCSSHAKPSQTAMASALLTCCSSARSSAPQQRRGRLCYLSSSALLIKAIKRRDLGSVSTDHYPRPEHLPAITIRSSFCGLHKSQQIAVIFEAVGGLDLN